MVFARAASPIRYRRAQYCDSMYFALLELCNRKVCMYSYIVMFSLTSSVEARRNTIVTHGHLGLLLIESCDNS